MIRKEVKSRLKNHLKQLDENEFVDLCHDILLLMSPEKIERYDNSGDRGRDVELTIPNIVLANETCDECGEWWWVECKKRSNNNISADTLGKNLFHILANSPPPPHLLLFMTTTDLTSPTKQQIRNISNPKMRYLNGSDICEIILSEEHLFRHHFPELFSDYKKKDIASIAIRTSTNIFVNAIKTFETNKKELVVNKNQPLTFDVTVKNITPNTLKDISIEFKAPDHITTKRSYKICANIDPFAEVTLSIPAIANSIDTQKSNSPEIVVETSTNDSIVSCIESSYDKFSVNKDIQLPLIGRSKDKNKLISAIVQQQGVVLVEGLPGEGKTRLLTEVEFSKELPITEFIHIGRSSLNSARSLLLEFFLKLLPSWDHRFNNKLTEMLMNDYLKYKLNIDNKLILDFLYRNTSVSDAQATSLITHIPSIVECRNNGRIVFVLDDVQQLTQNAMGALSSIIKIASKHATFILCYRDNEICDETRELLLQEADGVVKLSPISAEKFKSKLHEIGGLSSSFCEKLIDIAHGNPYCIVETLRLLKEMQLLTLNNEGLIKTKIDSLDSKIIADLERKGESEYAHIISLKRYEKVKSKLSDKYDKIDVFAHMIAAAEQPLPLSLFESEFGEEGLAALDEGINESIFDTAINYYPTEHGVYLIHDRLMEALNKNASTKKLFWIGINKRLAETLERRLDKRSIQAWHEKLAIFYEKSGNMFKAYIFLFKHFNDCVHFQHNAVVQEVGSKCLDFIQRIQNFSLSQLQECDASYIHLKIGLAQFKLANYDEMEKSFEESLTSGPLNAGRKLLIDSYKVSSLLLKDPSNAIEHIKDLYTIVDELKSYEHSNEDAIDAHLNSLNKIFLYLKSYKADYKKALRYNERAIAICQKHNRSSELIWELINKGTMILFQDEALRNTLNYSNAKSVWFDALDHWDSVLQKAESSKIAEHVVETNCAVGFMKMFLGNHIQHTRMFSEAHDHFQRARHLGKQFGHPFWLMKLHNHHGIHAVFSGDLNRAVSEFEMGLVAASNIDNSYTPWMMHQNLAGVACLKNNYDQSIFHWEKGLKIALHCYFDSYKSAIVNYQFRLFLRGLLVQSVQSTEIKMFLRGNRVVNELIRMDEHIAKLHDKLYKSDIDIIFKDDMYYFKGSYYNTH